MSRIDVKKKSKLDSTHTKKYTQYCNMIPGHTIPRSRSIRTYVCREIMGVGIRIHPVSTPSKPKSNALN